MNKFANFIYTNDGALTENECKNLIDNTNDNIEFIKKYQLSEFSPANLHNKPQDETDSIKTNKNKILLRKDFFYFMSPALNTLKNLTMIMKAINGGLSKYYEKYPAVSLIAPSGTYSPDIKYHIVKSGEGYHGWHSEWDYHPPNDRRILVWHISLTNHEDEGELEFLYHNDRIPAKAGRLIIWPAFFPWLHRGNAIRTDTEKHYLTGWFYIL